MTDDLRYPTGTLQFDPDVTPAKRRAWVDAIRHAPAAMREAVQGLTDAQFDTPYRPGGWTIRQVVHHVPDSHLNAYIRFKLALTEDNPTIKPYNEAAWAMLPDTQKTPPETSLVLLERLHERWVQLLDSLQESDFARPVRHPDMGQMNLDKLLQMYAWHGRHHTGHITAVRAREAW
jgi:uncharacterized damage-inducible protein DinB